MNYRQLAKDHLKFAHNELSSSSDYRLKYAALELRMAMEAITYDRALAYKNEFPPSEYETWQPKKVLMVLLEIDSNADINSTISIGIQPDSHTLPETMRLLGTEKIFTLKMLMLKKHYDALGSYLHIISMKQSRTGGVQNMNKLRRRCEEIYQFLDEALLSPVFNMTLGNFSSLPCQECGKTIRKRIPHSFNEPILASCFNCKAQYKLTNGGGSVCWTLSQHELQCSNPNCQKCITILEHELTVGRHWVCTACNGKNTIVLGIQHKNQEE
ncbi:hypothetical protein [Photobacterium damselae]|uniref:hypothetical protein n=1 Tax=Photobacterium damselae TaxID=38293 RepID=UPI00165E5A3D|nr:hypothetical protein [Photobacterium damselae]